MTTTNRIDNLKPGTFVLLDFEGEDKEMAIFLGIDGEGDKRRARFLSIRHDGAPYEWEAYRYNGRWAYGTSAQRLRLVGEILPVVA